MTKVKSVYNSSTAYAFTKTFGNSSLRPTSLRCVFSIFNNFFFRQFCFALLPGRVPVSRVDHPLDGKIPFTPSWVNVYIDFVPYWIRAVAFILRNYGFRSLGAVREFVASMGKLYVFACEVYRKNLSTTYRPFYVARLRFFFIHFLDPHLMCIPSLHVMVAVYTYTKFTAMLRSLGVAENCAEQIEEMRRGAVAICQAILFVKQHSVNCIGASLYAMTRFDPDLFPPEKAEAFCSWLFVELPPAVLPQTGCLRATNTHISCNTAGCKTCPFAVPETRLPVADIAEIKAHIAGSYRRFLEEGKNARSWKEPLLNFMRGLPQV